jgi:hypothetical protein
MYSEADNYLEVATTNACSILFEKAVPAGKLKREVFQFQVKFLRYKQEIPQAGLHLFRRAGIF